jgi:hypothetical protein
MEGIPPSGDQLVHVGLVAHIPDDLVLRRNKYAVKGDGELYDPEIRREMAPVSRNHLDDLSPDLRG